MVAGNHVPAVIVNYSDLASLAESGALRVLATTGAKRIPDLPDIPTARELGYDFDQSAWFGLVAPGKTPAP